MYTVGPGAGVEKGAGSRQGEGMRVVAVGAQVVSVCEVPYGTARRVAGAYKAEDVVHRCRLGPDAGVERRNESDDWSDDKGNRSRPRDRVRACFLLHKCRVCLFQDRLGWCGDAKGEGMCISVS